MPGWKSAVLLGRKKAVCRRNYEIVILGSVSQTFARPSRVRGGALSEAHRPDTAAKEAKPTQGPRTNESYASKFHNMPLICSDPPLTIKRCSPQMKQQLVEERLRKSNEVAAQNAAAKEANISQRCKPRTPTFFLGFHLRCAHTDLRSHFKLRLRRPSQSVVAVEAADGGGALAKVSGGRRPERCGDGGEAAAGFVPRGDRALPAVAGAANRAGARDPHLAVSQNQSCLLIHILEAEAKFCGVVNILPPVMVPILGAAGSETELARATRTSP